MYKLPQTSTISTPCQHATKKGLVCLVASTSSAATLMNNFRCKPVTWHSRSARCLQRSRAISRQEHLFAGSATVPLNLFGQRPATAAACCLTQRLCCHLLLGQCCSCIYYQRSRRLDLVYNTTATAAAAAAGAISTAAVAYSIATLALFNKMSTPSGYLHSLPWPSHPASLQTRQSASGFHLQGPS